MTITLIRQPTDRQADRQTDRRKDRPTDQQTNRPTDTDRVLTSMRSPISPYLMTVTLIRQPTDRQIDRQTDGRTYRQTDGQTDRQTDRQGADLKEIPDQTVSDDGDVN